MNDEVINKIRKKYIIIAVISFIILGISGFLLFSNNDRIVSNVENNENVNDNNNVNETNNNIDETNNIVDDNIISKDKKEDTNINNKNKTIVEDDSNSVLLDKEIDSDIKNELLGLIGLTENGMEKVTRDEIVNMDLDSSYKWMSFFPVRVIHYFIDLDDGYYTVNDLRSDSIRKIIEYSPASEDYLIELKMKNDDDLLCQNGIGECIGITPQDYEKVARRYGLTMNVYDVIHNDSVNNLYDGKYYILYPYTGFNGNIYKIEDKVSFELYDDKISIIYDIKLEPYESNSMSHHTNQTITFNFKKVDGQYNLSTFKIVNKKEK